MSPTKNVHLTLSDEILKLFKDSNTFDYTIENKSLDEGENASTLGGATTMSNSYLRRATQLSIARTIIHEMVHAYLNVKYKHSLDDWDFKEAMDQYAIDNGITDINSNKFHHEFMGQYVDAMAISLLSWDLEYGTGGIRTTDANGKDVLDWEYYRSMAFGGLNHIKRDASGNTVLDSNDTPILLDTESFKALVPNEDDRDKIKKIIKNEQKGNNKAKGTKCN